MKTIKKYLIVPSIALMLFSSLSPLGATENLEVNTTEKSKKVQMELATPSSGAINVMLYDEADRLVYSDKISAGETFAGEFDFSTVREGSYRLTSEIGNMRYNRILHVSDNKVEFTESYYSFTPVFRVVDDKLQVFYINNLEDSFSIIVEDESGYLYDGYYSDMGDDYNKTYGLQGLKSGSYTVQLMSGQEVFSFEFKL